MTVTGVGATGYTGLNDAMKRVYEPVMQNCSIADSEVYDLFTQAEGFEVREGPDGQGIYISHEFAGGGGVGAMLEDDYLYASSSPTVKQSSITIKQLTATVDLSGRAMRRVLSGPAAFATWADEALPQRAQRLAFHRDRMMVGTGKGHICRLNEATPDGSADGIDSAYGIAGLEGAVNLLLENDSTIWSPNSDGSSPRSGAGVVSAISYANNTFSVTAMPTSGADNDYVFLGDANVNGSGSREIMGLEGIVDDGTNVSTFQTLSRTTYPRMQGQIIDSTASPFSGDLTEDLVVYADTTTMVRGGGKVDVLAGSYSAIRSYWKAMKADRVINDPRGSYQGGKGPLSIVLGDRTVELRACRKIPSSRFYGIERGSINLYRIGQGHWDETDGAVFHRISDSTGWKDAFRAVYVEELELGAKTPGHNFKITGLNAA